MSNAPRFDIDTAAGRFEMHGGDGMRGNLKRFAISIAICCTGLVPASAAGVWKYQPDSRDNPILTYSENRKATLLLGCGRAFGFHVVYPGVAKKSGKARVTISSGRASMTFDGEFEAPFPGSHTNFVQWDLGFRRQDPALYGKRWKVIERRLLDLLGSRAPLTISAGTNSYRLPPNNARHWRPLFDACG
jgi:hypothetical protein